MRITVETALTVFAFLSLLACVDMLVDIPGVDIPDLKDIPWLFGDLAK